MRSEDQVGVANTQIYHTIFDSTFKAADLYAVWWQPVLKGLGRSHLEVAAANARTAQSWIAWTRSVSTARNPADVLDANMNLCRAFVEHWTAATPRVSEALTAAAEPVNILTLPQRNLLHDAIDLDQPANTTFDRKVA